MDGLHEFLEAVVPPIALAGAVLYGIVLLSWASYDWFIAPWKPDSSTTVPELQRHGWLRYARISPNVLQGWFWQDPRGQVWQQNLSGTWTPRPDLEPDDL